MDGPVPRGEGATGPPPEPEAEYRVADDVVAQAAAMAAAEVPGVAAMGSGPGLGDVLAKRHGARGVRVEIGTREVAVDVYLHVRYGERIPVVAQRVQENVRRVVEAMTALRVVEVNVHVQGLALPPPRAAPAGRVGPVGRPLPAPTPEARAGEGDFPADEVPDRPGTG
jgi:uncharacterized alkaline shock family protein YloU